MARVAAAHESKAVVALPSQADGRVIGVSVIAHGLGQGRDVLGAGSLAAGHAPAGSEEPEAGVHWRRALVGPRRWWGGGRLLGVLALCLLAGRGQATSPQKTARGLYRLTVTSALVVLPVTVTDRRGQFVSGLRQSDFQVYEDGHRQKVTVFEEGDAPVTVGLVVDHSGSMADKLPQVATAIRAFAQSSDPRDEMFLVNFNERASVVRLAGTPFTSNPGKLEAALAAVSAGGETALYDAVGMGLRYLQLGHWQRRALIVVSDGGDNASHLRFSQVLALARQSQASIYAIALTSAPDEDDEQNPSLLKRLCKDTGGIAYFPRSGHSVVQITAAIARTLRAQYTLGYVPQTRAGEGTVHTVAVKLVGAGHGHMRVRTRAGYSTRRPE